MSVSVSDFVKENKDRLGDLSGFKQIEMDLAGGGEGKRARIDNDTLAKRIMSHHYDSLIEQPLAKAFKEFTILKMGGIEDAGKPKATWGSGRSY